MYIVCGIFDTRHFGSWLFYCVHVTDIILAELLLFFILILLAMFTIENHRKHLNNMPVH
jgi:hypothetical protein